MKEGAMMINQDDPLSSEAEAIGEQLSQHLPDRLQGYLQQDLAALRSRFDEIDRAPNPGRVARKIRKRKKLSVEELSEMAEVPSSYVELFEQCGDIHLWTELPEVEALFEYVDGEDGDVDLFEQFIEALEPTDEEEQELRRDLRKDLAWLYNLFKELMPEDLWKELTEKPPPDPWDDEPKRKGRVRSRPHTSPLSPLSSIGSNLGKGMQSGADTSSELGEDSQHEKQKGELRFKLQLVINTDEHEEVSELIVLDKGFSGLAQLGLALSESKSILQGIQQAMIEQQVMAYLRSRSRCENCGKDLGYKGHHEITFRTLFGSVSIQSPRFRPCRCQPDARGSFSPLSELLTEHISPELLYMENKWASLVSYGLTAKVLQEFLPVDGKLNAATVRNHTLEVAERCEGALGDERVFFIDGCPLDWQGLPPPAGPITVGIDGGYLRSWHERTRNFEVIVGKSVPSEGDPKCFGLVQSVDSKPKRRLFDLLTSQGMQMNQQVCFLSDGEEAVRELQHYLNPNAEHILDWFHITMRITVLKQYIKGLVRIEKDEGTYGYRSPARQIQETLDSTKWKLWHGKVADALERLQDIEALIYNFQESYTKFKKLEKAVDEFHTYIQRNAPIIRNYGRLWRDGRVISTAFIESLVNSFLGKRFSKKQQMQWSPNGAHLLLQIRAKVANRELANLFQEWYPGFGADAQQGNPLREAA